MIDNELRPRIEALPWRRADTPHLGVHPLTRHIQQPETDFFGVLAKRSSWVGGPISQQELASVLWHSMLLRESNTHGRFGTGWESRSAPSAGGLHPLRLLCIPLDDRGVVGVHDPDAHVILRCPVDQEVVKSANRLSVVELTRADAGVTLQIVADPTRTGACYANAETLLLKDAGALITIIALVATALGLSSCPLGRSGTDIVRLAGLPHPLVGLGAIHLGSKK